MGLMSLGVEVLDILGMMQRRVVLAFSGMLLFLKTSLRNLEVYSPTISQNSW